MERRTEYRNGVMYLIAEDGEAYPLAEVMKYNNPSMDFDPATGDALGPAAPPAASSEAEMRAQAALEPERLRAQDTFGDTTMRMAQPYIDSAIDLAANAGRRPTYFSDPLLGGAERVGQYVGDMGLAGLSGLGALTYGGAGLMGEVFGGSPSDERMLARDLAAGIDVAGVGPEARAFGLLSDAVRAERGGVGNMTRGFLAGESGAVPLPFSSSLPPARNEAEAIAKEILELRATGNVDAVTERMMDAADPQYMYAYTPLAMDEASRLARAREMGAVDEYHGTTSGGNMRYPSPNYGSGSRKGIGFVTSNNPYVSSSYAAPDFGGTVFPMLNRPPEGGFAVVNTNGDIWSNIPSDARVVLPNGRETTVSSYASVPDDYTGGYRTDFLSRGAAIEGDGGVKFENIIDRGVHIPRVKDDPSVSLEFQREGSKPSSVMFRHDTRGMRARFARFDPMFAHLRNLSAGVAPFGLLAMQPNEEQY